ncbi:type II toxin-antitoxin system RelE/ParE family toxin [Dyadobacter sp. CY345]|uniref:type II toxin-antitoxin system RelE/ParE family toxin n=1 Tax=Dyadobacter sp. CY345 TaxID=2909335 RepID=UPI001F40D196|nr:type II toxin-antitoxin system RelE/ParE family toxin [Dyadobacter sp. CY345]MCF2447570.1 type II toxin-antitoxin system RelE/ParE family toxin [Dyadobacter sp. CY345]
MKYQILYLDDVDIDIQSAKIWYCEQKPGLEKRFVSAIRNTISNIQKAPFIYNIQYKNVRVAHTKIFPYGIHFYVDEIAGTVVIVSILHHKKSPDGIWNRI